MTDTIKTQREQLARLAIEKNDLMEELFSRLTGSSRRARQNAAATLSVAASIDPESVSDRLDLFVDCLELPEAQTRWECLDVLSNLVAFDHHACEKALPGAESALFDEDSGPLHLAGVRFLCKLGSVSKELGARVWPLLDEAIQCYHGDVEFQDMLVAVAAFAESDLDAEVREQLKERMEFDAKHARGILKKRAQHIIDNLA